MSRRYSERIAQNMLLAFAALTAPMAPAFATNIQTIEVLAGSRPDRAEWRWQQPSSEVRSLDIDLVNATVVIFPTEGAQVELTISGADQASSYAVRLVILETAGRFRVEDRYPPRSVLASSIECLPPNGERGDFWHYARPLTVRLLVPRGMVVTARTMAGAVVDRR